MSNDDYGDDILKRAKMLLSFMSPDSSQSNVQQYNDNINDQNNTQLNKVSVIKGSTIITTYNDVRHIAIRGSYISIDDNICQVSKEGEWTNKCITLIADYPGENNFDAIINKADYPEKVITKTKKGFKKKINSSSSSSVSKIKQAVANLDTILESSTERYVVINCCIIFICIIIFICRHSSLLCLYNMFIAIPYKSRVIHRHHSHRDVVVILTNPLNHHHLRKSILKRLLHLLRSTVLQLQQSKNY